MKKLRQANPDRPNPGRKDGGVLKDILGRSTGREDRTSGNKWLGTQPNAVWVDEINDGQTNQAAKL